MDKMGRTTYDCSPSSSSMPLKQHLFLLKTVEDTLKKFQGSQLDLEEAQMAITDRKLSKKSFSDDTLQTFVNLQRLLIKADNLDTLKDDTFSHMMSLETLVLENIPLKHVNFETFTSLKNLQTLEFRNSSLNCSCQLVESVQRTQQEFSRSNRNTQIVGFCIDEQSQDRIPVDRIPESEYCPNNFLIDPLPLPEPKLQHNTSDQPSRATLVLIIILSVILVSILLFAVVLFVSNRYCYRKKPTKFQPKTNSREDVAASLRNTKKAPTSNPYGTPDVVPTGNPKQVKFRPLSREYQSIDGCPFDTQIPVMGSPEKHKTNLPYSLPEQNENEPEERSESSNEEFHC